MKGLAPVLQAGSLLHTSANKYTPTWQVQGGGPVRFSSPDPMMHFHCSLTNYLFQHTRNARLSTVVKFMQYCLQTMEEATGRFIINFKRPVLLLGHLGGCSGLWYSAAKHKYISQDVMLCASNLTLNQISGMASVAPRVSHFENSIFVTS